LAGVDVEKLFSEAQLADDNKIVAALEKRLLQSKLKLEQEQVLRDFLKAQGERDNNVLRDAIRLVMSTPDYQLT
jgi:hypothetical protein